MNKVVPIDAVLIPKQAACVFRGIIYNTYQWSQIMFDDSQATFEMLRRPDSVSIFGIVDNKIIVLHDEHPHSC